MLHTAVLSSSVLQQQNTTNGTNSWFFCIEKQPFCDPSDPSSSVLVGVALFILVFLFIATMIFYSVTLVRLSRKNALASTKLFYACLICFSIGRTVYFLFRIIFRFALGIDTELEGDLSISHHIAFFFYYFASTFLYSAFIILGLNWAEYMLRPIPNVSFKKSRIFSVGINVVIHVVQIILLITVFVLVGVRASHTSFLILYIVQLLFHAVLSLAVVCLYMIWMIYVWRSLQRITLDKKDQMFLLMTMIAIMLFLRSGYNVWMSIYNTACAGLCDNIQPIIVAIAIILFDGLPLMWIGVAMKDSHSSTPQEIEQEANTLIKGDALQLHEASAPQGYQQQ